MKFVDNLGFKLKDMSIEMEKEFSKLKKTIRQLKKENRELKVKLYTDKILKK
jgi:hypothetical protein